MGLGETLARTLSEEDKTEQMEATAKDREE